MNALCILNMSGPYGRDNSASQNVHNPRCYTRKLVRPPVPAAIQLRRRFLQRLLLLFLFAFFSVEMQPESEQEWESLPSGRAGAESRRGGRIQRQATLHLFRGDRGIDDRPSGTFTFDANCFDASKQFSRASGDAPRTELQIARRSILLPHSRPTRGPPFPVL